MLICAMHCLLTDGLDKRGSEAISGIEIASYARPPITHVLYIDYFLIWKVEIASYARPRGHF